MSDEEITQANVLAVKTLVNVTQAYPGVSCLGVSNGLGSPSIWFWPFLFVCMSSFSQLSTSVHEHLGVRLQFALVVHASISLESFGRDIAVSRASNTKIGPTHLTPV